MAIEQDDIAQIQTIVHQTLEEWQKREGYTNVRYDLELRERIVRVEEELKHQRELMMEGFARMDQRLEQVDRRFEQVDNRFESIQKQMDDRFTALTRRIDRFMVWSFATTLTVGGIVIAVLKFT